jgi:hypothetical protein
MVVRDQCKRDWLCVHILDEAPADRVERMATRFPPGLPDAIGHGFEEFRTLAQVGDGECERH